MPWGAACLILGAGDAAWFGCHAWRFRGPTRHLRSGLGGWFGRRLGIG